MYSPPGQKDRMKGGIDEQLSSLVNHPSCEMPSGLEGEIENFKIEKYKNR